MSKLISDCENTGKSLIGNAVTVNDWVSTSSESDTSAIKSIEPL